MQRRLLKNNELARPLAPVDPTKTVEYLDNDGAMQDYYAVSTVDSVGNESTKTQYRQSISYTGPVCVLEGIVTDLQGVRVPDATVSAKLVRFPFVPASSSGVSLNSVETLSGPDGRFSLVVLQGALVQLEVPLIGYSRNIKVPEQAFAFVTDLSVDLDYHYPLGPTV